MPIHGETSAISPLAISFLQKSNAHEMDSGKRKAWNTRSGPDALIVLAALSPLPSS